MATMVCLVAWVPATLRAQTSPTTMPADAAAAQATMPAAQDGPRLSVTKFELVYQPEDATLPPIAKIRAKAAAHVAEANGNVDVALARRPVAFDAVPAGQYSVAALNEVAKGIVDAYNDAGYFAISVAPASDQVNLSTTLEDLRTDKGTFTFVVSVPKVESVRTLAFGERVADADRVNAGAHAKIRAASPVKAGTGDAAFFRKNLVDEYVYQLNRQPGRNVEVALSGGAAPNTVTLDYLVTEGKPWYVFAQVSNTGTQSTNEWRERFGFTDNQLTGHDDILSLDYNTASFDDSQAVTGSYDFPLRDFNKLRAKVYGTWSEFTASDVGFIDQQFDGDEWSVGAELTANVAQFGESFVDVVGGVRFQQIGIDNSVGGAAVSSADAGFYEPYAGLRFERRAGSSSTFADAILTYGHTTADETELDGLRIDADDSFFTLGASVNHSFYLEPIFDKRNFDEGKSTLANEVYLGLRGQYAFNDRLVPQIEETAGGLYSVRGYRESVTAGDNAIIGSIEYRYHVPRSLSVRKPGRLPGYGDFRWAPESPYGRPDWDLIIRPFFDAAYISNSRSEPFERDNTLLGTGLGLELQLTENFNFRCDWGIALNDVDGDGFTEVTSGSNRFHFVFTIVY